MKGVEIASVTPTSAEGFTRRMLKESGKADAGFGSDVR
jgi:hypothetical protein